MRTIIINKTVAIAILLLTSNASQADAPRHIYDVQVDSTLSSMQVEAHFAAPVQAISARSRDAHRFLQQVRSCGGDDIRVRNRQMWLPSGGITCLRYSVDLAKAARAERRNATLSSANIIVSPAAWFWRPRLEAGDSIEVRFDVHEPLGVSVPWQPVDAKENTYLLTSSPESSRAPAVFGKFEYHETRIPGALLRISLLNPKDEFDSAEIIDWVRDAASNVSLTYGAFPNPLPNVVVMPVGGSRWGDSPVPFGRVVRDGGETVELFINQNRPIDDFYDDWTATHEFSHLMLPYLNSGHRWISEGFAQYYQNLLLARVGQYSEQRAWQKLYEGLERGRKSSPRLSPNEAARNRWGSLMKVYWSGAALALLADVELRQRSNGEQSLDDVLERLQRCCLPSDAMWTGPQLFARLDSFLDEPVFMPLYRQHANAAGFPDVRPLLTELGVVVDDGAIKLEHGAKLASLRSAMTDH